MTESPETLPTTKAALRLPGVGRYEWQVAEDRLTWSPELIELYGLTNHPDAEPGFLSLVHPDDRVRVEAEIAAYLGEGESYSHEFKIVCPDGTIRLIHDRGVIERDADGRALALRGLNVDITTSREGSAEASPGGPAFSILGDYRFDVSSRTSRWSASLARLLNRPAIAPDPTLDLAISRISLADRERVAREMEAAMRRIGPFRLEYRIEIAPGDCRWVEDRGETIGPIDQQTGLARTVAGTLVDITAQKRAEDRLAAALRAGGLGIHDFDPQTGQIEWDLTTRRLWGVEDDEPINYETFATGIVPEDLPHVEQAIVAALDPDGGGSYEATYRVKQRGTGAVRWVRADGAVTFQDGRAVRLVGTVCDITARKEAEQRIQDLLLEANHRSKNLLTLVQAIARQSARSNADTFIMEFERRLTALSKAQELLVGNHWGGVPLAELVRTQLDHLGEIETRVHLDGPVATLTPDAAQALGMALHELSTNAVKYGALSNSDGRVTLSWSLDSSGQRLSVRWTEHGGPPVSAPTRRGFGTEVIDRIARASLGGSVEIVYHPLGLAWYLDCRAGCLLET